MLKLNLIRMATLLAVGMLAPLQAMAQNSEEVAAAGPTPDISETANQMPGLEYFVDGLVMSTMKQTTLPGVTVSVVKDGEIVLLKGYGHANLEEDIPVDPEKSMFRIGSITKTMTSLAVMQLGGTRQARSGC